MKKKINRKTIFVCILALLKGTLREQKGKTVNIGEHEMNVGEHDRSGKCLL